MSEHAILYVQFENNNILNVNRFFQMQCVDEKLTFEEDFLPKLRTGTTIMADFYVYAAHGKMTIPISTTCDGYLNRQKTPIGLRLATFDEAKREKVLRNFILFLNNLRPLLLNRQMCCCVRFDTQTTYNYFVKTIKNYNYYCMDEVVLIKPRYF
jgi:hypothetical protein